MLYKNVVTDKELWDENTRRSSVLVFCLEDLAVKTTLRTIVLVVGGVGSQVTFVVCSQYN